jgi:DNA-directed RNA polymerase specialized sigma24 family protein
MPGQSVWEATERRPIDAVRDVSLEDLRSEALEQEHNFVNRLPSQDAAGVELFRRAIDLGDERAWATVIELYRGLLHAQAGRQVIRGLVDEDDAFCVDRAFQRFWRATRARGMHDFGDLGSILKYLKLCLGSVLLDEARARKRQSSVSIDDLPPEAHLSTDPTAMVIGHNAGRDLWLAVDAELRDDDERSVAYMSFVTGLTPHEIFDRCADHFADITDIYRIKRNVIDRLRRSPAIQSFRE